MSVMLLRRGDRQLQLGAGASRFWGAYMQDGSRPCHIWSALLAVILESISRDKRSELRGTGGVHATVDIKERLRLT